MADYDKYYTTENLFGEAYPKLIAFFKQYEFKGKLLDLGCGQGRDCIPLAKLGYKVTGIDNSKVGIDQMLKKSEKDGLNITGLVGDIFSYNKFSDFDIVLLDSMFHFNKGDIRREIDLLNKIAKEINKSSLMCICIQDTGKKVKILKETIDKSGHEFEILNDSALNYLYEDKETGHKSETKYCMYIIKKKL